MLQTYFSQGRVTRDLRGGGSFNFIFLHVSFLNLTAKKNYENWSNNTKFCHLALGVPVVMTNRVVSLFCNWNITTVEINSDVHFA